MFFLKVNNTEILQTSPDPADLGDPSKRKSSGLFGAVVMSRKTSVIIPILWTNYRCQGGFSQLIICNFLKI